jgi:hypothetical protein
MVEVTEIGHHLVKCSIQPFACISEHSQPAALDTTALPHLLSVAAPTQPKPCTHEHFTYNLEPCSVIVQYYDV